MKSFLFILPLLGLASLTAQQAETQALTAGGGHLTNGSISLSAGVGELATPTLAQDALILTQGLLQSGLNTGGVTVDPWPQAWSIRLYPNPVSAVIQLETDAPFLTRAQIWDAQGKAVLSFPLSSKSEGLAIPQLTEGNYLLTLHDQAGRFRYQWRFVKQ